jgi:hypothetical protein
MGSPGDSSESREEISQKEEMMARCSLRIVEPAFGLRRLHKDPQGQAPTIVLFKEEGS